MEKSAYLCSPFGNEGKFIERIGNNKVQASTDFNTIKIKKEQSVNSFYIE